jgi:hypothetical protein
VFCRASYPADKKSARAAWVRNSFLARIPTAAAVSAPLSLVRRHRRPTLTESPLRLPLRSPECLVLVAAAVWGPGLAVLRRRDMEGVAKPSTSLGSGSGVTDRASAAAASTEERFADLCKVRVRLRRFVGKGILLVFVICARRIYFPHWRCLRAASCVFAP